MHGLLVGRPSGRVLALVLCSALFFGAFLGYANRNGALWSDGAQAATTSPVELGVYLPAAPSDMSTVDAFTQQVGASPQILMWYQVWGNPDDSPFYTNAYDKVTQRGIMPLITWEPWAGTVNDPSYSLASIANGSHDEYIRQFADDAAAWGKPFYLRFAHEMNGNWYPWGQGVNGNTPAEYVQAWRHVHDLFVKEGATNAIWVWSPNVDDGNAPFTNLYPGDAYVDWVALDGYNAASVWNSPWMSLGQLFGTSYDTLAALTSKPMMIAETASTEVGGNKAAWITDGFLSDIPTRLPRVKAVIWFDKNKETDWRVDSSAASLAAFQQVVASPLYGGPSAIPTPTPTPATPTPTPVTPTPTPVTPTPTPVTPTPTPVTPTPTPVTPTPTPVTPTPTPVTPTPTPPETTASIDIVNGTSSIRSNDPHFAFDGNIATSWFTSSAFTRSAFITFDLGSQQSIASVNWWLAQTNNTTSVEISTSVDSQRWSSIVTLTSVTSGGWQRTGIAQTARYVRFTFSSPRGGHLGYLSEVQVVGTKDVSANAIPVVTPTTAPTPVPTPAVTPTPTPSGSSSPYGFSWTWWWSR